MEGENVVIGQTVQGILIPFIGTSLGAAGVFFLHGELSRRLRQSLLGFAAGVMAAASVWSLLLPALEQAQGLGRLRFLPAAGGFLAGIGLFLLADRLLARMERVGPETSAMLMLAVTLHNIPEGMAVGVVYAGLLCGGTEITPAGALALSVGIAVQNFPEGGIISLPMQAAGKSRGTAFAYGVLSGAAEPLGAVLTILAAELFVPVLPWLLSASAGAMFYVVVEELLPEIGGERHSESGIALFGLGFAAMMILDVALG